jgi:hypothetical protein
MSTLRVVRVWLILAGLMVCNGLLRVGILAKVFPPRVAEAISAVLGVIIVIGASRPYLRQERPQTMDDVYRVAGLWLILTMVFETSVGLLGGLSWRELLAAYAVWDGAVWPLVLISVVASPFIWLPRIDDAARRAVS